MKTLAIIVYFGIYNGVPEVEAHIMSSIVECHERGISATLYARERPDIEAYTYMCLTVRAREPGQPT